jgi:hypothetical protein
VGVFINFEGHIQGENFMGQHINLRKKLLRPMEIGHLSPFAKIVGNQMIQEKKRVISAHWS